jgi:tetratricopeptide (TPR) repeat protein
VPFDRNQQFVGRDSLLNRLKSALFAENQAAKFAIYGLGGIGKTQIALELAYRAKETYHDCSVFWVPATNVESLQQAFENIGRQLGVPGLEDVSANVKNLVQRYLNQQSAGQWLLILDNVDEVDMWYTELKPYLPKSPQGCVICTTRNRKVAVKIAEASNIIELSEMDEETAMQLLAKSLGIDDPELLDSRQDALKLLEQLTFLPLAIVQAAAYINENRCALSEYLSLLEAQEHDVVELLSEDFEDDRRYDDTKNPVATTWLISFQHIQRTNPLAAEYLSFMSCVDPKDIPQSLLPPAQSRKKEIDALGMLDAYSFVSRRAGDQALDMHRLVHLATRSWLRKEGRLAEWAAKAMQRLEEVFPEAKHENRRIWRLYLAHALYMLRQDSLEGEGTERAELIWRVAGCLHDDGRYKEAEPWYLYLAETAKTLLGEEHPSTLRSISNLALAYMDQGRWKEAEELGVQVIEISKRMLGKEHPDTLFSMANLALTYARRGQWSEAEKLQEKEVEICSRVLGEEHPDTLAGMANLASTYMNQGRFIDAEGLETQVLGVRKRVLGEEHPDTLNSINNLATTYYKQGRLVDAESLGTQVLDARKRVLGEEHPDTLNSINNLATMYKSQGQFIDAEGLETQALGVRKRVLGEEHPDTLSSMANLASTYCEQGRLVDAESLGTQVLDARKRVLGEEHPGTLISMANLASTLRSQGRFIDAESLETDVMDVSKRVLGEEHPDTLNSMANLSSTYYEQGQLLDAESLGTQVLDARKRVLGEEHPDTLTSINNLAFIIKAQGRNQEALLLLDESAQATARVLGPNHPHTESAIAVLNEWCLEELALDTWSQLTGLQKQEQQPRKPTHRQQSGSPTTVRYPRKHPLRTPSRRIKPRFAHQTQQQVSHRTQRRRTSAHPTSLLFSLPPKDLFHFFFASEQNSLGSW